VVAHPTAHNIAMAVQPVIPKLKERFIESRLLSAVATDAAC
jgi:hypothetical protein